jgi:5-methylthioadenosine/S-adenosylhomocysteine deaminase
MRTRYDAPWIVAYQDDGTTPGHRLLRDGCVVVEDDRVVFVGADYDGPVDSRVRTDDVIAPGYVSTHAHLTESPVDKSLGEDSDRRQFWSTSLVDILPPKGMALDVEGVHACVEYSIPELLLSGCTTVLQMGNESEYFAHAAERHGIRAYVGEGYKSGRWLTRNGRTVEYEWSADGGEAAFQRALELCEGLDLAGGRVRGAFSPMQVDTCSADLLRASREAADRLDLPISVHAAQSVFEFLEMTRRHGRTPIEWLADIGFLSSRTIIGHGIFTTGSPWVNFAGDDLGLLAEAGTTVAHSPWVFARNGIALETFKRYRDAGVRLSLGTDTVAQSMLEAARWAAVLGKVLDRSSTAVTAAMVFEAGTIAGADALGRADLGRIAPGAKADLVFYRTDTLAMTPMRDPIRNIVYYAQPSDVRTVLVDGVPVVEDGATLVGDQAEALAGVQAAAERVWDGWRKHDWAGRAVEEHFPLSYPAFDTATATATVRSSS